MTRVNAIRIDKFLWSVRIFKTRSIAAEECRRGRILINNIPARPSRQVFKNDIITIKKLPVVYTYLVIEPLENRVSAKLVENFIKDLTPDEEKNKLKINYLGIFTYREKGSGRPTKKERRTIDRFIKDNNK